VRVYWPAVGPSHRILPSPLPRIAYSDDEVGWSLTLIACALFCC
jgi:hypothetical protein